MRIPLLIIGSLTLPSFGLASPTARFSSIQIQGDELHIAWQAPAGWMHVIEWSPALGVNGWSEIHRIPSAPATNQASLPLPLGFANAFYRLRSFQPGVGPRLLFSDLESGPNTGGQGNLGPFITLWGEGFKASRGASTITIGGQEVARYVIWGEDNAWARQLDMIVVQPGSAVNSGDIVVTVDGQASAPLPYKVREGRIFFVAPNAPNANDANAGTFDQPWRTLYQPRAVMMAGDIVYVKGGVFEGIDPVSPSWDAVLYLDASIAASGTSDKPIAYLGYPGESPTLANAAARRGFLMVQSEGPLAHYVIGNLIFSQSQSPLPLAGIGHRIVGNYLHDGAFDDGGAIGVNTESSDLKIFGNLLRNNGQPGEKLHHAFYIGGYGTNRSVNFGWNEIHGQHGGRAIQLFGHLDGDWMDAIAIHDNLVSGSELDNIVIGGSDGNTAVIGTVSVFNNIIGGAGESGLRVNDPAGTILLRHNLWLSNGTAQLYLQRAGPGKIILENNIIQAGSNQVYFLFEPGITDASSFRASHNLVYNAGGCPAWDSSCVLGDPRFVNPAAGDFRLGAGSPAIDAGTNSGPSLDFTGIRRPMGPAADIGAHEYAAPLME